MIDNGVRGVDSNEMVMTMMMTRGVRVIEKGTKYIGLEELYSTWILQIMSLSLETSGLGQYRPVGATLLQQLNRLKWSDFSV